MVQRRSRRIALARRVFATDRERVGRGRVKRGEADNRRPTNAGIITGVVGIVLAGGLIALGVSILNSPAGKNLQHCLKNAHGNKAAVSQCESQYASGH
jgi:hypothetical protein